MADIITELDQFDETVARILVNDPVKGDDDSVPSEGISNAASKSLANRTRYLLNRSGAWMKMYDRKTINGSGTVDVGDEGKHIIVTGAGNCTITLGGLSGFGDTAIIHISCFIGAGKTCTIKGNGSEDIQLRADVYNTQYMMTGEYMTLIKNNTSWLVLDCSPSIYEVGQCVDGYAVTPGYIVRNGAALSRADYARLYRWVNDVLKLQYSASVVTEATWNASVTNINGIVTGETVYPYKGFFSSGDLSTTFRLPDDRGRNTQYMDMSSGNMPLFLTNAPGGYLHDWVKKHVHAENGSLGDESGAGKVVTSGDTDVEDGGKTGLPLNENGSQGWQLQNTVRSTSKIPLIKY